MWRLKGIIHSTIVWNKKICWTIVFIYCLISCALPASQLQWRFELKHRSCWHLFLFKKKKKVWHLGASVGGSAASSGERCNAVKLQKCNFKPFISGWIVPLRSSQKNKQKEPHYLLSLFIYLFFLAALMKKWSHNSSSSELLACSPRWTHAPRRTEVSELRR